ncbi:PREDICTED: integrin alpha-5-like, partial [Dufourea novaeangliae]|uniref:integrin alpha-5-like n=1 Tax=Dufourea novaeangliae TaxID=178035 RepID=UPI0007673A98
MYNLDVHSVQIRNAFSTPYSKQRGSYFGYSIAFYVNGNDSILLVGAPRANVSTLQGVIEPGTVYQCPLNNACKEWHIDETGNGQHKHIYREKQSKDNAWIGATIAVENKNSPRIVICGPRWTLIDLRWTVNRFMTGICYWAEIKSFNKEVKHGIVSFSDQSQLIITRRNQYVYNLGMGLAGFSLHVSNKVQWTVILGAPGALSWRGTSFLVTESSKKKIETINLFPTYEVEFDSGDYSGYAVTSGNYFEKGELWFASSSPHANNMHGKVVIFNFSNNDNKKSTVKKTVYGDQLGEYFGAALTSCDLNNDYKDELIIGAPQWAKDMDEGRIYILKATHSDVFEKQMFEGGTPGSRFGSVITCLGDIDYDGYADFAVGAPYEEQTGAIYIFNGNSNGLLKRYSQKIIGKEFGEHVRGFGMSISESRDINNDRYPDIAVGAPLSDQVIIIKSKPVVAVTTELIYLKKQKLLQNSTLFLIQVCTSYNGTYAPTHLEISQLLKVDEMYGRAFYDTKKRKDNIHHSITLQNSKTSCTSDKINLKIQNIIDPLEIFVSVKLKQENEAIINKFLSKTEDVMKLPFAVDCGEDNVCTSDVKIMLSTDLKFGNKYTIGSSFTVKLIINAYNYGEPAYQAKIYIYIPNILFLASVPSSCMEGSHVHDTLEIICDIGNPLRANKTLILDLDLSEIRYGIDQVKLMSNFTMQSEQKNSSNHTQTLIIYFDVDVDVAIAGKTQDDLYSYFGKVQHQLNDIQFEHVYEVQKFGVSPLEEVVLTISIPTYWKHSTEDIQIINLNKTTGYMDGQQLYCTHSNVTPSVSLISIPNIYSAHSNLSVQEKFKTKTNFSMSLPPVNRSLYLDCANTNVQCTYLECKLSPFTSSLSVAKVTLMLDLYLKNFKSNMLEGKDIIYFLSNGTVNIAQPYNITQKYGHKPDNTIVATMFLGSPVSEQLATWIILLSIALGIVLLVFLIIGLVTIGFFNRKKREELQTLK